VFKTTFSLPADYSIDMDTPVRHQTLLQQWSGLLGLEFRFLFWHFKSELTRQQLNEKAKHSNCNKIRHGKRAENNQAHPWAVGKRQPPKQNEKTVTVKEV
jgi:hypothetical protein